MSWRPANRRRPKGPLALAIAGLGALVVGLAVVLGGLGAGDDAAAPPAPTATSVTSTLAPGSFFLEVTNPPQAESLIEVATLVVEGRTRADAVVSVNDVITAPDADGRFAVEVTLEEGTNIIEVVASVESGGQLDEVLAVIYLPP